MPFLLALMLLGQVPAVDSIPDEATFDQISTESRSRPDIVSATKFLVPASLEPTLLPTVFQNVNLYPFHLDYLVREHPERFAGTTVEEYRKLVEQRATREYFAGVLQKIRAPGGGIIYGFDVYTDVASVDELPLPEEIERVFQEIDRALELDPLVYAPLRSDVIEQAKSWTDAPFPIYVPDAGVLGTYSAYTSGIAYGTVRIFDLATLVERDRRGEITWRDIIGVDEAPSDLSNPVAGVITGSPQVELSHLVLRLAQRGTPNAFSKEILDEAATYDGRLVRLEVGANALTLALVDDPAEAEEFWETNRPRLPVVPSADLDEIEIRSLDEIAGESDATSKYGAKAANLALLRTVLSPEDVVDGFAIPFAYFEQFLEASLWKDSIPVGELLGGFEEDPTFRNDASIRTILLDELVDELEDAGMIPDGLVAEIVSAIEQRFGSRDFEVRFRSSSNLEDSVPFNGAGLYESTSACAADSLDGDGRGPSICDATEDDERTIERALRRVWASFWAPRAYNERDYWSVPWSAGKMGVLVTEAFSDEIVNGVVLSGDPATPGDDRVVINAQLGEESVVHPDPGVLAEKVIVEVDGGVATRVDRVRHSTLAPDGEWLLSVDEARWIGERVDEVRRALAPRFQTALGDIIFDFEFKVESTATGRRIVFKQLRPFLREPAQGTDTLAIVVPEGSTACGVFQEFRTLQEEYDLLSTLRFVPGRIELAGQSGTAAATLIEEIVLGPEKTVAVSLGDGALTIEADRDEESATYRLTYAETFIAGEHELDVKLRFPILFADRDSGTGRLTLSFDEAFLSRELDLTGSLALPDRTERLTWASCSYEDLPRFEQAFVAASGDRAILDLRYLRAFVLTGPENVVGAEIVVAGERRTQNDYWRLVYSADHHNENRRFWVFLDPPIGEVDRIELREPARFGGAPAAFRLLDQDGNLLREIGDIEMTRVQRENPENPDFLRGDANSSAIVDVADVVHIARSLFFSGVSLACADAADVNDDSRVDVTDAVWLLLYFFGDDAARYLIPDPGPDRCDRDPTADPLPHCDFDVTPCGS